MALAPERLSRFLTFLLRHKPKDYPLAIAESVVSVGTAVVSGAEVVVCSETCAAGASTVVGVAVLGTAAGVTSSHAPALSGTSNVTTAGASVGVHPAGNAGRQA